eukprot:sb/3467985/
MRTFKNFTTLLQTLDELNVRFHLHILQGVGASKSRLYLQEPTETSKQPIRTRCLGHMTGYQLIESGTSISRFDRFLYIFNPGLSSRDWLLANQRPVFPDSVGSRSIFLTPDSCIRLCPDHHPRILVYLQEPTETSKQPIRTRCLGHMTGYQLIESGTSISRFDRFLYIFNPGLSSRDWLLANQRPVFPDSVGSRSIFLTPDSCIRVHNQSRDWLPANQGPVFLDSVATNLCGNPLDIPLQQTDFKLILLLHNDFLLWGKGSNCCTDGVVKHCRFHN